MEKVFCSVAQVRDGIKDGFHIYFSVSEKLIFELNFLWLQLLNWTPGNKDPAYNWKIQ